LFCREDDMADTYPLVPNRITNIKPEFKTTIVKFEGGYEQRFSNHGKPRRTFRLEHQLLRQDTEVPVLEAFFFKQRGAFGRFYLVNHIDGQTYTVRFKEDGLQIDYVNAKFANVTVEVVEC
jgi:phage-related protein